MVNNAVPYGRFVDEAHFWIANMKWIIGAVAIGLREKGVVERK